MGRGAGPAVRLLSERADHDGQSAAGQDSESDRRADSRGYGPNTLPLHDVLPRAACDQASREDYASRCRDFEEGGARMTSFTRIPKHIEEILSTRRDFLKKS